MYAKYCFTTLHTLSWYKSAKKKDLRRQLVNGNYISVGKTSVYNIRKYVIKHTQTHTHAHTNTYIRTHTCTHTHTHTFIGSIFARAYVRMCTSRQNEFHDPNTRFLNPFCEHARMEEKKILSSEEYVTRMHNYLLLI